MGLSFFLAVFAFTLCSCEDISPDDGSCPVYVDDLKTQISECQSRVTSLLEEVSSTAEAGADGDTSCIQSFAFGVTVGVFSTLAGIIINVCCCVFRDRKS